MVATTPQSIGSKRAAVFFGAVLCLLLAFFAVERRVAAYPAHNIAATTIAATGVERPQPIAVAEPQNFDAPVLFVCALALCVAFSAQCVAYLIEPAVEARFLSRVQIPLAVRPPPVV